VEKSGIAGTQNNHCVFATLREVGYADFILLRSVARPASWQERRTLIFYLSDKCMSHLKGIKEKGLDGWFFSLL
jgi:hypothetical protein